MKVTKKINNNVALCIDSKGVEAIAIGKGIGFKTPPYEVELSMIDRVFYNIDQSYVSMIADIRPEIVDIATRIAEYARLNLDYALNPNVMVTLADHINFCIDRHLKKMNISLPLAEDIQYMYEKENRCGLLALELIKKELGIYLPKQEAQYIALHLINAELKNNEISDRKHDSEIVEEIAEIVEDNLNFTIDKDSFDYSRFVTHMHYLLKRSDEQSASINEKLFESLISTYEKSYHCSLKIKEYLKEVKDFELNNEELSYLILHINRLQSRKQKMINTPDGD